MKTERVGLRKFCPTDLEAFAAINADPQVMEFFPDSDQLPFGWLKDHLDSKYSIKCRTNSRGTAKGEDLKSNSPATVSNRTGDK
jgi:RimJ/RimL family protein N-acetyltransferase